MAVQSGLHLRFVSLHISANQHACKAHCSRHMPYTRQTQSHQTINVFSAPALAQWLCQGPFQPGMALHTDRPLAGAAAAAVAAVVVAAALAALRVAAQTAGHLRASHTLARVLAVAAGWAAAVAGTVAGTGSPAAAREGHVQAATATHQPAAQGHTRCWTAQGQLRWRSYPQAVENVSHRSPAGLAADRRRGRLGGGALPAAADAAPKRNTFG